MIRTRSPKLLGAVANGVLLLHVALAVFAVAGGFLVLLDPIYALVHVPLVLWVGIVNLTRLVCPLTPLEQRLRLAAGQESFEGGWVRHYCEPLIRPCGMPRRLELVSGISILVWNAVVYAWIYYIDGVGPSNILQ